MNALRKKARLLLCTLILLSFFLPAYRGVSGFGFIPLAFDEVTKSHELTMIDVVILLVPLVLIPVSAAGIGIASWLRIPVRKTFAAFPLLCLLAFICLLLMSSGGSGFSGTSLLSQMGVGFYLALPATAYLPFTKNMVRKRRRRRQTTQLEAVA
ncbi:MAG TPA: hypothetical protein VMR70_01945 [Flavisolibacter sp.]|nr:hypothetical protein [Flavisolibacter sp.]